MDGQSLLATLIIGAVIGWLAGQVKRGYGFGLLGNIVVGILGSFLGGWLFGVLGISLGAGLVGTIITGVIGAVVLLAVIGVIRRA